MARSGVADVDALAFQIFERCDAAVCARDNGEWLWVNRKDGPQTFKSTIVFETGCAVIGVVLPVGLGNAEFQLAFADCVDVVDRATGGFHRTADTMVATSLIDEAANCATRWIINTGHAASSDGDKVFSKGGRCHHCGGYSRYCGQFQFGVHCDLPLIFCVVKF